MVWRIPIRLPRPLRIFWLAGICLALGDRTSTPAPKTSYAESNSVTIVMGPRTENLGLREIFAPDGSSEPAVIDGVKCRMLDLGEHSVRYLYFAIDPSFKWKGAPETNRINVEVEVEYFDSMPGSFDLQYDARDPRGIEFGAYTTARNSVRHTGVQMWRSARFELTDAKFMNSQNNGADFRLRIYTKQFYVRQVTIFRRLSPALQP